MAYIARTNGGQEVLEIREGSLASVAEADRANWRTVVEVIATTDGVTKERGAVTLTVNGDGSQVNMLWPAVDVPLPIRRHRLKLQAADKAWRVETGGIQVGEMRIPTDDRAKLLLQGAAMTTPAEAEKNFVIGTAQVTMTGAQLAALWSGIVAHVDACFAARAAIYDAIDADEVTTAAQVEAWSGWP